MTLCRGRTEEYGWGDGHRMVVGEVSINLWNNKRQNLGPEWSMSEVGTLPPHNSEKPHRMVASINNNMWIFLKDRELGGIGDYLLPNYLDTAVSQMIQPLSF